MPKMFWAVDSVCYMLIFVGFHCGDNGLYVHLGTRLLTSIGMLQIRGQLSVFLMIVKVLQEVVLYR